MKSDVITAPPSAYNISAASAVDKNQNGGLNSSNFNCRNNYSILPQTTLYTDGTGEFEACRSTTTSNRTDIELHGRTIASNTVCIYPAMETGPGVVTNFTDSNGYPTSQCKTPYTDSSGQTGIYYSFAGALGSSNGFNAAYAVEGNKKRLMDYCLLIKFNDTNCGSTQLNYSYGRF